MFFNGLIFFNMFIDRLLDYFNDGVLEVITFETLRCIKTFHNGIKYLLETTTNGFNQLNDYINTLIDLIIAEYSPLLVKLPN